MSQRCHTEQGRALTSHRNAPEDAPPYACQPTVGFEGEQVPRSEAHNPEANDVEPHQGGLPPKAPAIHYFI